MTKSYRFLVAALLISLIAGTAFANEKGAASSYYTLTAVDATESPSGRDVYILSVDFAAMPQDYSFGGIQFGSQGILPVGSAMVGFGFDNVVADVYFNPGATYSNWAVEAWLGCTYDDLGVLSFVGTSPFSESEGPGTFGPASNYFALAPTDWPMPTYAPFTFYAESTYDDGTGLAAGTFTSGVLYVEIDSPTVSNEETTLSSVKALYR